MPVVMRFLHIGAAVVAVGGVFFVRLILLPSLSSLEQPQAAALMQQVARRFHVVMWTCIAMLLLSGIYNYLAVIHDAPSATYKMILHIKLLLALIVFAIAFALTLPAKAFEKVQQNRKLWLGLNLLLTTAIIAMSAYLRRMWTQ